MAAPAKERGACVALKARLVHPSSRHPLPALMPPALPVLVAPASEADAQPDASRMGRARLSDLPHGGARGGAPNPAAQRMHAATHHYHQPDLDPRAAVQVQTLPRAAQRLAERRRPHARKRNVRTHMRAGRVCKPLPSGSKCGEACRLGTLRAAPTRARAPAARVQSRAQPRPLPPRLRPRGGATHAPPLRRRTDGTAEATPKEASGLRL